MLLNHFKIAFRSLFKQRRYTLLNIAGLAMGMATCLLLLQYVGYELSFDRFHTDSDQIYRVINDRFQNGERVQKGTITYPTIGPVMAEEYPEIERYTRIFFEGNALIRREEEIYRTSACLYADEHFFDVFSFELLAGDRKKILTQPFELVLTEKIARHFFDIKGEGFDAVLGQEFEIDRDGQPYTVVGVCADFPSNSLLEADILPSYKTFIQLTDGGADNSWQYSDFYHFLKLRPDTEIAALEAQFVDFSLRHFKGEKVSNAEERFYLQPLHEAHLYSNGLEYEIGRTSNGLVVWSMLGIAFFILLLAWVNYINLASVRAIERAKEVGIRRIVGADKSHLFRQFIIEAAVINGLSFGLAVLIAFALQPSFVRLMGEQGNFLSSLLTSEVHRALLLGLAGWMVAGIGLSGLYPAFLLLRQQATDVLKGNYKQSERSKNLRRGLVVFQFAASITLISVTVLAFQQLRFLNQQDLGVDLEQLLRVSGPELTAFDSTYIENIQAFKESLKQHSNIEAASTSSRVPGENTGRIFGLQKVGGGGLNLTFRFIETDHDYEETYGLQPLAGRGLEYGDHNLNFSALQNVVINQEGAKALGYKDVESAINQRITFWNKEWTIVGVLPDFHQQSFHHPIEPIVFLPLYNNYQAFTLRVNSQDIPSAIQHIEKTFHQFFPGNILDFQFLDQRYQRQYEADQQFGSILLFFTILSILIACLGIFGLASYMAFLRTREIGIRKVLGASVAQIVSLLSRDFVRLALTGALIAIPLGWYLSGRWLQDFSYRIEIQWWVFVLGGGLAVLLAVVTVGIESVRAAASNPADSLKSE
jgi:putative ABC transport system permease protein